PDSAIAHMATNQHPTLDGVTDESAAFSYNGDIPIDLTELQNGDLLFKVASSNLDGVTQAIVSSVEGINLQQVSHVAIVHKHPDGQIYALEASGQHGVWLNPIDSFLIHCDHNDQGQPLVLIGRLKDKSIIDSSVKKALTYIGRPYDYQYLPGDSAIYCSELVHLAFEDAKGEKVFPQNPMSFHNSDGTIIPFWIDYYKKWDMDVPEGMQGTHPGGISRSNKIKIIGQLFNKTKKRDTPQEITLKETEIVGTRAPLPADKAIRLVQVINRKEIEASSVNSVNDLLKLAAGVDVRQRGGFGIQTDIGINGGNEDQLTLLINGINISNPHTGHLTADLPVSVDDIERIEVIEGGASRVFGSQAFAGAINIVTRTEQHNNIGGHVEGGSYGTFGANAHLTTNSKSFFNRVSGGYIRSDGASQNDDFNKANAFWNSKYENHRIKINTQVGVSSMNYGANTFYGTGSDSQYEEDRRYLVALHGELKGKIRIPVHAYWNRSLDHYVWWRNNPEAYQNFHQTNVYGANANAYTSWALGKTAIGIEFRRENILSTRLGKEINEKDQYRYKVPGHSAYYKYKDGRSNLGLYLEHNILWNKTNISFGLLANHNTSVEDGMKLYPGVDMSWRPTERIKVFASFNQSLRTPTFTDLYYNGPGLEGNSQLKSEKSTDWHIGMTYNDGYFLNAQIKGFYRQGTDIIDWIKYEDATIYTSANSDVDNIGAEALMDFNLSRLWGNKSFLKRVTLSYCYNYKHRTHQKQSVNYVSNLTFLRHKFVASLNHRIFRHLNAKWDFTLKNREGAFDNAITGERQTYGTFGTLDLKLQWTKNIYTLYVQANNLTNHKYYDFANIQQPGIWFMSGMKINLDL
ncbi:MAG: TonB-dependent receptor, partial [Bacteroidaceae bacterium]|nr:TonB-dependent receptor [Bacteroidaceae bacterium]